MNYATSYDVGDRKRGSGINEDSIAVSVFEDGHRDGYHGETRDASAGPADVALPENRSAAAFALADGAGGHDAGDVASYIATTVVCEQLAGTAVRAARADPSAFGVSLGNPLETPTDDDIEAAIGNAIVTAHRAIVADAASSGTAAYTTVVAGVVAGGSLHVGWVGDSRAYVVNEARNSIARLTKDHAVVERLADKGELDDIAAHVHPRGNEITRALGGTGDADPDHATVEVDTRTVPLYAEDVVVVTSDGLVDAQTDAAELYREYVESGRTEAAATAVIEHVVTDDDVREIVRDAESLTGAAARFVDLANDSGGKDNISTVLLQDDTLEPTPDDADLETRDVDVSGPVEDRETVIVPDE